MFFWVSTHFSSVYSHVRVYTILDKVRSGACAFSKPPKSLYWYDIQSREIHFWHILLKNVKNAKICSSRNWNRDSSGPVQSPVDLFAALNSQHIGLLNVPHRKFPAAPGKGWAHFQKVTIFHPLNNEVCLISRQRLITKVFWKTH